MRGKEMTDEDFKEIVQELRRQKTVTNFGIQELLSQKEVKQNCKLNRENFDDELKNNTRSAKMQQYIFQGKESFLEKASKDVAEASKNPIYKRDSIHQQDKLRRVSNFRWKNMSEKWNNIAALLVDDEFDDDEEDTKRYFENDSFSATEWSDEDVIYKLKIENLPKGEIHQGKYERFN